MASRGFGFRSKQPESKDRDPVASAGLFRKPSLTSSTSKSSKLPVQGSSIFSRSKHGKFRVETPALKADASSTVSVDQEEVFANVTPSQSDLSAANPSMELSRGTGLGISGKGASVQLSKSGKSRNVLRRKAPTIESRSDYARTESSASSYETPPFTRAMGMGRTNHGHATSFPDSVLGIATPTAPISSDSQAPASLGPSWEFDTSSSRMARYNSRNHPSASPMPTTFPPTPNLVLDSGSSTRRSESPGNFSRTSTPTSMSSQSPGISTPVKIPLAKPRQRSPDKGSRPPVALENRRRPQGLESSGQGLTAVRESGTSSSSSSTVKASGPRDDTSKDRASPGLLSPVAYMQSQQRGIAKNSAVGGQDALRQGSQLSSSKDSRSRQPTNVQVAATKGTPPAVTPKIPPTRPSREGVPSLGPLDTTVMTTELGLARSGLTPLGRSPSSASSIGTQRSRLLTPNVDTRLRPSPSDTPLSRDHPSMDVKSTAARTARGTSPQSATVTKSTSRFGLFSRRQRSPMKGTEAENGERAMKKGPAAGTGHEGYGKYAKRGRSGSMSTSASRGRSTSSTSIGRSPSSRKSSLTSRDEDQIDDFYRDRLQPKRIVGGTQSVINSRNGSDVSLETHGPGDQPLRGRGQQKDMPRLNHLHPSTTHSSSSTEPSRKHTLRHIDRRLPYRDVPQELNSAQRQDDHSATATSSPPTLATRRSLHRSQLFSGAEPVKIPAPIKTQPTVVTPALDSQNAYLSSVPHSGSTIPRSDDISEGHEGNWLAPRSKDKSTKSPSKWSFFQRAQISPKRSELPPVSRSDHHISEPQSQHTRILGRRPVAFYEMLNTSEKDALDSGGSQQLAEDLRPSPQSPTKESAFSSRLLPRDDQRKKLSVLLPSPPKLGEEFLGPSADLPGRSITTESGSPGPSSEGGFIPSIPEPRKPRLQQIGRIPRVVSKRDRPHRPPPQSFSRPRPYLPRPAAPLEPYSAEDATISQAKSAALYRPILGVQIEKLESHEIGLQESTKPASAPGPSSDDGLTQHEDDEFLAFPAQARSEVSGSSSSGIRSFADNAVVLPARGLAPTEEEEWNEYNDFLDVMESPAPMSKSDANPYETSVKRPGWAPAPLEIRKEPSSASSNDHADQHASTFPPATPPTRRLPSPPKRSKNRTPVLTVASSIAVDATSRGRNLDIADAQPQRSSSRYSSSSIESEADSLAGQENQAIFRIKVPAHLRLELLTISKSLTFDRVLFSPAHAEVSTTHKTRILVLDGLGIDDWAFFCAQEYPEAHISNLSAIARTNIAAKNYDHHYFPSLDGPFPFPQNYFTAAVLRFPVATAESAYCNVIKEFRRVLSPGGYLEISALDLDMVKMGSMTRKVLRGLKQKKQAAEPRTSLKPISDSIQKMLGGKAFENLKQCMLEIPVAGQVSSSRVRSFNEKMELLDEMPRDEDRTRHLSEVGRFWYSRCYEAGPLVSDPPPKSIWDDKTVLEECEANETGFKMLLCYAQKPNKRRTLSL